MHIIVAAVRRSRGAQAGDALHPVVGATATATQKTLSKDAA